jgi:predicted TPR repeat methyltransferase
LGKLKLLTGHGDRFDKERLAGIASGFDQWSDSYDDRMFHFNYVGPQLLFSALQEFLNIESGQQAVLDAGCGTGLCGILLRPLARQLDGVDISQRMLKKARQRGLYDRLEEKDLVRYLDSTSSTYDLVISAGVLQFFSDVEPLFSGVNKVLRNAGCFAFTIDKLDAPDVNYKVSPRSAAMYLHNPDYIRNAASATNFRVVKSAEVIDRNDMLENKPVRGVLFVFQKGLPGPVGL